MHVLKCTCPAQAAYLCIKNVLLCFKPAGRCKLAHTVWVPSTVHVSSWHRHVKWTRFPLEPPLGGFQILPAQQPTSHFPPPVSRAALESPHVSSHLHTWIDLMWGHALHPPAAIAHSNLHLSVASALKASGAVRGEGGVLGCQGGPGAPLTRGMCRLFDRPHPRRAATGFGAYTLMTQVQPAASLSSCGEAVWQVPAGGVEAAGQVAGGSVGGPAEVWLRELEALESGAAFKAQGEGWAQQQGMGRQQLGLGWGQQHGGWSNQVLEWQQVQGGSLQQVRGRQQQGPGWSQGQGWGQQQAMGWDQGPRWAQGQDSMQGPGQWLGNHSVSTAAASSPAGLQQSLAVGAAMWDYDAAQLSASTFRDRAPGLAPTPTSKTAPAPASASASASAPASASGPAGSEAVSACTVSPSRASADDLLLYAALVVEVCRGQPPLRSPHQWLTRLTGSSGSTVGGAGQFAGSMYSSRGPGEDAESTAGGTGKAAGRASAGAGQAAGSVHGREGPGQAAGSTRGSAGVGGTTGDPSSRGGGHTGHTFGADSGHSDRARYQGQGVGSVGGGVQGGVARYRRRLLASLPPSVRRFVGLCLTAADSVAEAAVGGAEGAAAEGFTRAATGVILATGRGSGAVAEAGSGALEAGATPEGGECVGAGAGDVVSCGHVYGSPVAGTSQLAAAGRATLPAGRELPPLVVAVGKKVPPEVLWWERQLLQDCFFAPEVQAAYAFLSTCLYAPQPVLGPPNAPQPAHQVGQRGGSSGVDDRALSDCSTAAAAAVVTAAAATSGQLSTTATPTGGGQPQHQALPEGQVYQPQPQPWRSQQQHQQQQQQQQQKEQQQDSKQQISQRQDSQRHYQQQDKGQEELARLVVLSATMARVASALELLAHKGSLSSHAGAVGLVLPHVVALLSEAVELLVSGVSSQMSSGAGVTGVGGAQGTGARAEGGGVPGEGSGCARKKQLEAGTAEEEEAGGSAAAAVDLAQHVVKVRAGRRVSWWGGGCTAVGS